MHPRSRLDMADQAHTPNAGPTLVAEEPNASEATFPPKGEPVFTGINRIGLWSLYIKEVRRFLKVQTQTIWGPAVSTILFLIIFDVALAIVLYPGAQLHLAEPWAIVWFGLMGATMLSLFGLLTSIWAEKFDHNAAISTLIVAPLALLSGTFYTIDRLAGAFETISRLNPFFYVISGFRYGFLGQSDIGEGAGAVVYAAIGLGVFNLALALLVYAVLKSGWKLKS